MAEANNKRPVVSKRKGTQRTKNGYEIPIPKTEDFDRLLRKAATKRERPKKG